MKNPETASTNQSSELSFFFAIGKIINLLYDKWKDKKYNKLIGIVLLIVGYILSAPNTAVSCMNHEYGNYWLFAISAVVTSLGFIFFIQGWKKNRILEYIGNNTIGILIFHKLVIVLFQTKLGIISTNLLHGNIIIQIAISLVVLVLSVSSCLIPIEILKRFCPILIGEKRKS